MKAQVGDRLVKDGGDSHRVCEIIGLHHADGSPPYIVRWLSDGHIALLYPGPYTRLVHHDASPAASGPASARGTGDAAADGAAGEPDFREAAAGEEAAGGHASGGQRGSGTAAEARADRPPASRAKPARQPAAGRRWAPAPFVACELAAPWSSRGTT